MTIVGLISDTHGLLRPEAVQALAGSRYIIHAGDVGDPAILDALAALAPVTAVRGNVDTGDWASSLRLRATVRVEDAAILVLHDLAALKPQESPGYQIVVSGHSHRPEIATRDGLLLINPGSAGRRRFRLPITVARLVVSGGSARAYLVELVVRS